MPKNIKKMLVNVDDDETRIATVTGNVLENLHIEQTHHKRIVGNIYHGIVVKVQTSFQAAFIDYGGERHGFLAFSDVNPHLFKNSSGKRGRTAIEHVLKPGQPVMVQVTRNEMGNKGVSLTTNISLPGRFLVFMPNSDKGGVSKKIEDAEARTRLKHLLDGLCGEKDSAIIRTAGVNRSLSELKRDFLMLRRKWNKIQKKYESTKNPQLIYEEEDVVVRTLRDFFIDDIAEIWIDHPEAFQRAREFFKASIPAKQKRLQFYLGERSLFSAYDIEAQIEQLSSNQVPLASGGSLVIDSTEALVAIDVNSGRFNQGKDIEDTALRTNLEAAEEISRQLQLRNLGGLIVIDFIDMISEKNRNLVIKTMEECLQHDKAKWTLGSISQFGLLEMSRQRIATALSQETKTVCPTCGGVGMVLSIASLANAVLRKIRELAATEDASEIHSRISVELSNFLFNKKRQQLDELEAEFGIKIVLSADLSMESGKLPIFELKTKTGTQTITPDSEQRNLREKQDQEDGKGKSKRSRSPRKRDKSRSKNVVEAEQVTEVVTDTPDESVEVEPVIETEVDTLDEEKVESELPSEEPPKIPTLFSSVHQPSPDGENNKVERRAEDPNREKLKNIPPGTILYSSIHRDDPQGVEGADPVREIPDALQSEAIEAEENQVTGAHDSEEAEVGEFEKIAETDLTQQDIDSVEAEENEGTVENDEALDTEKPEGDAEVSVSPQSDSEEIETTPPEKETEDSQESDSEEIKAISSEEETKTEAAQENEPGEVEATPKKARPRKKTTAKSTKTRSTRTSTKAKTTASKTRTGTRATKSTAKKAADKVEKPVENENAGETVETNAGSEETAAKAAKTSTAKKKTTTRKKTAATKRKTTAATKRKAASPEEVAKSEDKE